MLNLAAIGFTEGETLGQFGSAFAVPRRFNQKGPPQGLPRGE